MTTPLACHTPGAKYTTNESVKLPTFRSISDTAVLFKPDTRTLTNVLDSPDVVPNDRNRRVEVSLDALQLSITAVNWLCFTDSVFANICPMTLCSASSIVDVTAQSLVGDDSHSVDVNVCDTVQPPPVRAM